MSNMIRNGWESPVINTSKQLFKSSGFNNMDDSENNSKHPFEEDRKTKQSLCKSAMMTPSRTSYDENHSYDDNNNHNNSRADEDDEDDATVDTVLTTTRLSRESDVQVCFAEKTAQEMKEILDWYHDGGKNNESQNELFGSNSLACSTPIENSNKFVFTQTPSSNNSYGSTSSSSNNKNKQSSRSIEDDLILNETFSPIIHQQSEKQQQQMSTVASGYWSPDLMLNTPPPTSVTRTDPDDSNVVPQNLLRTADKKVHTEANNQKKQVDELCVTTQFMAETVNKMLSVSASEGIHTPSGQVIHSPGTISPLSSSTYATSIYGESSSHKQETRRRRLTSTTTTPTTTKMMIDNDLSVPSAEQISVDGTISDSQLHAEHSPSGSSIKKNAKEIKTAMNMTTLGWHERILIYLLRFMVLCFKYVIIPCIIQIFAICRICFNLSILQWISSNQSSSKSSSPSSSSKTTVASGLWLNLDDENENENEDLRTPAKYKYIVFSPNSTNIPFKVDPARSADRIHAEAQQQKTQVDDLCTRMSDLIGSISKH